MSDFTRDTFVTTRRLTIRYILALTILGLFLGMGNILLQSYIIHQKNHALRINLAGRQRMLSQRIALVVHHIASNIEADDPDETRLELLDLVNQMARAHEAFITGDVDGKLLPPNPPEVQKLYFESPTNLDLRIKMFLDQATRLANLRVEQLPLNDSLLSSFHPSEIATLLRDLDSVTGEYEEASNNSISFLIFLENLLLLGGIVVLILVALLIFRPMVSRIQFEVLELRKLSIAMEQSPASIVITNLNGDIEYVNPKFTQVTGYSVAEAVGPNPRFLKSGVQSDEFYRDLWETITAGREWRGEFCNKKKSGELFWESASISPIKGPDGEITHFMAVKEDITERKQAEEALAEKTIYLDNILRSSTEYAIATTDLDFRITYYNPMAEKLHGYKAEDVLGKTIQEMHIKENVAPERFDLAIDNLHRNGEHCYTLLKETDAGDRCIAVRISGIYDSNGELVGYANFAKDITERKQAEEALRESEEKYRVIIETANEVIITMDEASKILFANPKIETVFGYSPDEVIGKSITDLMMEDTGKSHLAAFQKFQKSGQRSMLWEAVEVTGKTKNGAEVALEISFAEFHSNGSRLFTGILRDISRRKGAEAKLAQSAKLAAIGELAAGVAHEINNPLTNIYNYTQLLGKKLEGNEYAEERVQKIIANILRVRNITRGLTTLSREPTGTLESVHINRLLAEIIEEIQSSENGRADLIVESNFQQDLPKCKVDEGQIRQVINNLVKNAIDAMPGGGTLALTSDYDFVNKIIRILISDTGIGIPKSDQDTIFNPFFTTKAIGAGTGLGLSVSSSLIKQNGGDIAVESEEGLGTTFIISLPIIGQSER